MRSMLTAQINQLRCLTGSMAWQLLPSRGQPAVNGLLLTPARQIRFEVQAGSCGCGPWQKGSAGSLCLRRFENRQLCLSVYDTII